MNEKIWKGIDEGIYKQDSEEMALAWQEAIAEVSKESLKVGIHRTPGQWCPVRQADESGLWIPGYRIIWSMSCPKFIYPRML